MKLPLSDNSNAGNSDIKQNSNCIRCKSWPLSASLSACGENVLSTIVGNDESQRLVLCSVSCDIQGSCVELQRQSWSDSIGWFTQSRVRIAKDEINFLRAALGGFSIGSARTPAPDRESISILKFPA